MRTYLAFAALCLLAACNGADKVGTKTLNGVATTCADASILQPLVPLVAALAGQVPGAEADVKLANALLMSNCAVAPDVEALALKMAADLKAANAKK